MKEKALKLLNENQGVWKPIGIALLLVIAFSVGDMARTQAVELTAYQCGYVMKTSPPGVLACMPALDANNKLFFQCESQPLNPTAQNDWQRFGFDRYNQSGG